MIQEEKSQSIIEMSLTELAFVFYFILLIFSALKFIEFNDRIMEEKEKNIEAHEQLQQLTKVELEYEKLRKSVEIIAQKFNIPPESEDDEIFQELILISEQIDNLEEQAELREVLAEAKEALETESSKGSDIAVKLLQAYNDSKGQNINLRQKIVEINKGNGLDHPPCWSDSVTGKAQYVFDVVINEDSIVVHPGWPSSREKQATSDSHIMKIPGEYETNPILWRNSIDLFRDSEKAKCRHIVRIYDNANTKTSYKTYMRGIENHFYKFLDNAKYESRVSAED